MPPAKPPVTTPAPKYGPTNLYGGCEHTECAGNARVTCPVCDGHFCRTHVEHETHAEPATHAER